MFTVGGEFPVAFSTKEVKGCCGSVPMPVTISPQLYFPLPSISRIRKIIPQSLVTQDGSLPPTGISLISSMVVKRMPPLLLLR